MIMPRIVAYRKVFIGVIIGIRRVFIVDDSDFGREFIVKLAG